MKILQMIEQAQAQAHVIGIHLPVIIWRNEGEELTAFAQRVQQAMPELAMRGDIAPGIAAVHGRDKAR